MWDKANYYSGLVFFSVVVLAIGLIYLIVIDSSPRGRRTTFSYIPANSSPQGLNEFGNKFKSLFNDRETKTIYSLFSERVKERITFKEFRDYIQDDYKNRKISQINYNTYKSSRNDRMLIRYLYYNTIVKRDNDEYSEFLVFKLVSTSKNSDQLEIWGFEFQSDSLSDMYDKIDPLSNDD